MKTFIRAYKSFHRDERGSATLAGILFALILVVLAAAIVDVYRVQDIRTFAYGAANDAALRGASFGRDWNRFTATGELGLDTAIATNAATNALTELMQTRGLATYTYRIEVLPDPGGGTINDFPPVARAELRQRSDWSESEPAVGVYVEISVPTLLFGLINGNQPIAVHAFAAAGVIER
jgi:hypothetical protein